MEDFGFNEMLEIQRQLQERYKSQWMPIEPQTAKEKLLWMMVELGEIADVIKKDGNQKIMEDKEVRSHFIEEMCDALMYFNDVMLCYGITTEEFKKVYLEKHERNLKRW